MVIYNHILEGTMAMYFITLAPGINVIKLLSFIHKLGCLPWARLFRNVLLIGCPMTNVLAYLNRSSVKNKKMLQFSPFFFDALAQSLSEKPISMVLYIRVIIGAWAFQGQTP